MKKVLIIMVALLAMVFLVSGVVMAEEKRPALGTPEEEKLQTHQKLQGVAIVKAYDAAAKTITLTYQKKDYDLTIAEDATIKGAVKPGAKVRVDFKKEEGKRIATSISVMSTKRAARAEKAKAAATTPPKEDASEIELKQSKTRGAAKEEVEQQEPVPMSEQEKRGGPGVEKME